MNLRLGNILVNRICEVGYCQSIEIGSQGMCENHVARKRRGLPNWDKPSQYEKTFDQRFLEKIDHLGTYPDSNDPLVSAPATRCHIWTANKNRGYGVITVNGRNKKAHRISLERKLGREIQEGFQVDHLCRNVSCVNPEHLEEVDGRTNSIRSASPVGKNSRKAECIRGHRFVDGSFYLKASGARQCKKCNLLTGAILRKKKKLGE